MARFVTAAALLVLAACGSPEEKASKAAARYDVYYARRDFYSARIEIKRAIAAQDDVPEYWARLARVELASGQLLDAYQAYARLIELDPGDSEAIQAMAELSYSGGYYKDSEKLADQILAKQPSSLRMLLVKGSIAAVRQDAPAARAIAERMLAIDPGNEGGKILLARVMTIGRDRDGAIALLEKAVAADGESIPKLMALLDLYNGKDDFPSTARTFARLFALMPRDVDLRLDYARLLYEHGRPDRALELIARLTRAHPGDAMIQQRIVDLWDSVGSDRIDVGQVRRFVDQTGNATMKVALGHLLLDQKRYAEAEADLRPFIDTKDITAPRVEADVLYAGALSGLGRGGEALALVDRILRFDENNPRALLMRVRVEMAAGDLAAALRDAQVLTSDNPRITEGRVALAEIYVRRRETVLADNAYASAMKDLSDDTDMLEAYLAYLLRTRRESMALDISKRFTRDNLRSRDGWRVRGELCMKLGDATCTTEALLVLEQLPGGMKIRRMLEARGARVIIPAGSRLSAQPAAAQSPLPASGVAGQAASTCGRTGAAC
ncbi:MAG: tetratricopeptide repeat protein [Pseudomonadota bacterium]